MLPEVNVLVVLVPPSVALHPSASYPLFAEIVGAVTEHELAPLYAVHDEVVELTVAAFVSFNVNDALYDLLV